MRLKRHREDMKWMKESVNETLQVIARRYLNLIRLVEDLFDYSDISDNDKKAMRVLKDAEK